MMMPSSRFILFFLILLGAGSLPMLRHLSDFSDNPQKLIPGVKEKPAMEGGNEEDMLDSKPPVNKLLEITGSRAPDGWMEEKQQQAMIQDMRHRRLSVVCSEYEPNILKKVPSKKDVHQIYGVDRSKLLYCEVPKVGCSNWKRVLMVLAGVATSVFDIPHVVVHRESSKLHLGRNKPEEITEKLSNYTKVLFVREPFERLVSAFRDKLENPEKAFHHRYGRNIISRYRANASQTALQTGDGVTFREFAQYLVDPKRPVRINIHWQAVSRLCHPCLLNYNFIGKFENANYEANFLLRSIGAPPDVRYPDYKDRNPQDERTSSSIMKKYFSQLNATERQRVYDFYRMDYLMFNYSKPLPDLH
ncbi:carbohydrate sulfotransferase 8-like [Notolabrus celidotus]|uniref:carbohydrate sulfotransferase 8-like n=1 Tax=Notolabrus celidotus TaxID=1203425 RepID=UPI00148FC37E|nr:carbohydrate sulfotransferase 8-like [Notolabrus celidotus]